MIGETISHYHIEGKLGQGGMGEVYRARDTRLGRDVALKVLPPGKVTGELLQRFLREARAASQLNHPNVVAIYDIGESRGLHFIVMECVEGQTLSAATPGGGWEPEKVAGYAKQIASALVKAHAAGIVHRDLKPSNIMLTPDGAIKVLDFGLAKVDEADEPDLTAETQPGAILGTASYMSPEQAKGRPADARSDIFSLGLVLYEMLSGQRAFPGHNAISTMAAILGQEPRPLREAAPRTPAELERIVSRCMRKDADKRFQSALDLMLALEDLAGGSAVAAGAMRGEPPSIAVLPFSNLGTDKENEYFSDGLAEEILNALTQLPGLRVIARASAFAFRGREHELGEIAEKLKVRTILQGSVRRAGNRIRVTAQLIDIADESQLWSERYDREMTDVFEIQDDVARSIVEKLKLKLNVGASEPLVKRYTENAEAHSLYLKGVYHLSRYAPTDLAKAGDYLRQAVTLEPGHAQAWVQLAEYYIHRSFSGPSAQDMPRALDAAQHAVAADPSLSAGHAALAIGKGFFEHRWPEAMALVRSAESLPPTSWYYLWSGCVFSAHGMIEEALRSVEKVLALDPLSALSCYILALLNNYLGRYDRAIARSEEALEINADFTGAKAMLGLAYMKTGRLEEGIALQEEVRKSAGHGWVGYLAAAYVQAGRRVDAERLLSELKIQRESGYASMFALALSSVSLGDVDQACHWLSIGVREHDPWIAFLPGNPYFEPLRADPRYREALRPANLPNYP